MAAIGTGWVDGAGSIPEIPLECYNFIIDLGDFAAKAFDADDAGRSRRWMGVG